MSPQKAAQLLPGLEAPCGVFVIQGNHDFTFGWNNWKKELTRIGFRILADKSVLITLNDGRRLQLSGLRESFRYSKKQLPQRHSPNIPHIVLCHRPEIDCILSEGDADFIISGHTHGGQIRLPFNLLWFEASPDHTQPYTYPWHISAGNKYLITKGLGTSTLPLRFNCPPEIYLLTLH